MKTNHIVSAIILSSCIGCSEGPGLVGRVEGTVNGSTNTDAKSRTIVELTDAAVSKFKEFLAGDTNNYVRLSIKGDGASGFSYDLQIDDTPLQPTDFIDNSSRW